MRPGFSTYIIKNRAKSAMQGKFFKAFAAAAVPTLMVLLATVLIVMLVPGAKDAFELSVNGRFATVDERAMYINSIMDICIVCVNLLTAVFGFLFIGAQRMFLDLLRGREVKVKNIFMYFNKWYIAFIYPAVTVAVTGAITALLDALEASGMNAEALSALAWVLQIAIYYVALKLMFVELILADNNCTGFLRAIKASWQMVRVGTMVNLLTLALSFIGWFIAAIITGGVAFIYLVPYMALSVAAFYEDCKAKQNP